MEHEINQLELRPAVHPLTRRQHEGRGWRALQDEEE